MEYVKDPLPQPFSERDEANYLHLRGANQMEAPLQVVSGTQEAPSLAPVGDERTGVFFPRPGAVGISVFGWERLVVDGAGLHLVGRDGSLEPISGGGGATVLKTNGETGWMRTGQPVRFHGPSGVIFAQADDLDHVAQALAAEDVAPGAEGRFLLGGPVSALDWTQPTGGGPTLTTGAEYFLSQGAAGVLTTIPPDGTGQICQFVGLAQDQTTLFLNLSMPIVA